MRLVEKKSVMSLRAKLARVAAGATGLIATIVVAAVFHIAPVMAQQSDGAQPQTQSVLPQQDVTPAATTEPTPALQKTPHIHRPQIKVDANGGQSEVTPETKAQIQQQMEDALRQLREVHTELNSPEFKRQIEEATRNDSKLALQSDELKKQIAEAQKQFRSEEFKKQMAELQQQIKNGQLKQMKNGELQQQMEQLRPDCDAFWHVRTLGGPDYATGDEQRVRDHLGRFGFTGDRAFEPVGRFSGGEKARLTLALLVARRPNLLLLDEPTNHLDIDMRHALTVALQSFEGGMVVVSHDRHLIKTVADTLWLVADGKLSVFDGDLDDYQRWLRDRARSVPAAAGKPKSGNAPRDSLPALRREMEQIERRLATLAAEQASLGAAAGEESTTPAKDRRLARLARDASMLEARWMEIGTAIEAAEARTSNAG